MSVDEALQFFGTGPGRTPAAEVILERLADVGLGYVSLGQPLTTLSGVERTACSHCKAVVAELEEHWRAVHE